ncbi:DUF167 family protein [Candidatus Methylocalor cossyra]|uniref:UPF0235 protein MECH1_V1_0447 n=1 Tax=Candidatus Methylocalor cossyra TaxID=3108543 RepID=A0ABM9NF56_9GAMM
MTTPWLGRQGEDLILEVHVQPGAPSDEVVGLFGQRLKIRIAAPPVDGKANRQLVKFLAKIFGVSQRDVVVLAGETSRDKRIKISSPKRVPPSVLTAGSMD